MGTAGFVIALSSGKELVRKGVYLGKGHTVNDSEVLALRCAVEELHKLEKKGVLPQLPIRILGDSQLIMRFMLRIYR